MQKGIEQGVKRRMVLVVNLFDFLTLFCFVFAIFDLVHYVEANYGLWYLLAFENIASTSCTMSYIATTNQKNFLFQKYEKKKKTTKTILRCTPFEEWLVSVD